jgi:hypothetical protein
MTNEEQLRAIIRKLLEQELDEISTSAGAGHTSLLKHFVVILNKMLLR